MGWMTEESVFDFQEEQHIFFTAALDPAQLPF
jgi:hypothetical protein